MSKLVHYKVPIEKGESMYTMIDPKTKVVLMELVGVTLTVPNTDTILEDGNLREIRFIHGAPSIYVDEQIKAGFLKDRKKSALDYITLIKGNIYIDAEKEKMKALYMEKCNYNLSNTNRDSDRVGWFIFVDKAKEATKELNNDMIKFQAQKLILQDLEDNSEQLRRLGKVLLGAVDAMEDDEIKGALLSIIKKDPERVLTAYKTLSADTDEIIADAEKFGIIKILPTKVMWTKDETNIMTTKAGKSNKGTLVEFLSKPENFDTLTLLKNVVKEQREVKANSEVVA